MLWTCQREASGVVYRKNGLWPNSAESFSSGFNPFEEFYLRPNGKIIPLSQMDVDGKCRWNFWTENNDAKSTKKSLRTWSWKNNNLTVEVAAQALEKHATSRRVRPSPDLMEIEVFGDFWLSSNKSALINNQSFWNISLKKTEFRQSVQESVNWNIAEPHHHTRSTGRWTCFRLGLHEGASTTGISWKFGN